MCPLYIRVAARIVAETGATVTDFSTLIYKKLYQEKDLIDIGVLRCVLEL
jgi:hypothetical protein